MNISQLKLRSEKLDDDDGDDYDDGNDDDNNNNNNNNNQTDTGMVTYHKVKVIPQQSEVAQGVPGSLRTGFS